MLNEEETKNIKEKIIEHINKNFSDDQKDSAINQVIEMNSEELESFLEKNNLIKDNPEEKCIFCSIASNSTKSCKIGENEGAVAILDINPISKGQCLIISKNHSEENKKEIEELLKDIIKKIENNFCPKKIETKNSEPFGHNILSVLPVYSEETFDSEKKPSSIEELEKVKEELEDKKEDKNEKSEKSEGKEEYLWIPKRIP